MSEFKAGEFKKYKACVGFAVGLIERNLTIGEVVEYDGFKAKFETGEEKILPNFRACIKQGWLVHEDQELIPYRPKSANIRPRPAIADEVATQSPTTPRFGIDREENQVVSNIGNQGTAEGTPQGKAQVGSYNRIATLQPSQTEARVGSGEGFEVVSGEGDEVVISSPSFGGGAQISGEDGNTNLKFTKIGSVNAREIDSSASGAKLGQKAKGRSIMADADQSDLAVSRAARGLKPGDATHEYLLEDEEEEPTPKKKAAKKKVSKKKAGKKKVAKQSSTKFEWNLQGHWKTRLKKAMEYKDEPETMIQILAIESPTQSSKILKAWKEYQAGA